MNRMTRIVALRLLDECTGRDIWPVEHCLRQGVPRLWVDEMADAFESGFLNDKHTIYFDGVPTNQFYGVRDLDLAMRLAGELGVDGQAVSQWSGSPESAVQAIKEAVEEG